MAKGKPPLYVVSLVFSFSVCHAVIGASPVDGGATSGAISVSNDTASIPDFDGDGTIGFGDFVKFAAKFGLGHGDDGYEALYDLNDDGAIGFPDLLMFAENFGKEVPSPIVAIPDANLRAAIAAALGKASGATITVAEMKTLTRFDVTDYRIGDLSGLEFATNLIKLTLYDFYATDLSPLAGLTNLTWLNLYPFYAYSADSSPLDVSPLADLTNLTELIYRPTNRYAEDLSPLSGLVNLTRLDLRGMNHYLEDPSPLDLSALSGMTKLTELELSFNNIADILPLSGLTDLTELHLHFNKISDISPLSGLTNLTYLDLRKNKISDVSPLAGLTNLREVSLSINNISDLAPLTTNRGLGSGDIVDVRTNPLDAASMSTHISALQAKGVRVSFDEFFVFTDPQVYDNNVFVLPVSDNLADGNLPLTDYTERFYRYFNDEFDFLMFVPNLPNSQVDERERRAFFVSVKNDVEGIGRTIFSSNNRWASAGKLQGVINFGANSIYSISERELSILSDGPTLHELMHRWANFIVPSSYGSHWGFSSANGNIGGFDIVDWMDLGGGRYTAGYFTVAGVADNIKPYSPIELYLAGFIPPEEVPDLWVAADGEFLRDEDGNDVRTTNGEPIFTASKVKTYTIEDIMDEHGARVPDHTDSQKDFRAAVILLVSEDFPATREVLETISRDVSWFSHAGDDESHRYNFYEATGGRGTITMGGLSQFKRNASGKITVPNSIGTPPPPVVDRWDIGTGPEDSASTLRHIPAVSERP